MFHVIFQLWSLYLWKKGQSCISNTLPTFSWFVDRVDREAWETKMHLDRHKHLKQSSAASPLTLEILIKCTYPDTLHWPRQWQWGPRLMLHISAGRSGPEKAPAPADSWPRRRGRCRGSRSLQTRCSTASLTGTYRRASGAVSSGAKVVR